MPMRKIVVYVVIAAAVFAGVLMRDRSAWGTWVRLGLARHITWRLHGQPSVYDPPGNEPAERLSMYPMWKNLTWEELLDVRDGSERTLLALARAHPDIPERFWQSLDTLNSWERDPDNGWPLVLKAVGEARVRYEREGPAVSGISREKSALIRDVIRKEKAKGSDATVPPPRGIPVVDPETASRVVSLIQEAAGKKRITMNGPESYSNAFGLVGDPETFEEAVAGGVLVMQLRRSLRQDEMDNLCHFLYIEAMRRLAATTDIEERLQVYDIFHDLQTIGAKMVVDATGGATGYSVIATATEQGCAALIEARMDSEAEDLRSRGLELARPYLVARLALSNEKRLFWGGNEELVDGAARTQERLIALRASPAFDSIRYATPVIARLPWSNALLLAGDRQFTLESLRASARFEYWAWEKAISNQLTTFIWAALTVFLAVFGIRLLIAGRNTLETVWPSPAQVFAAALLFACPAMLPGLAVAFAGPKFMQPNTAPVFWLAFINIWGFLSGAVLLWLWARSRNERDEGDSRKESGQSFLPGGAGEWSAVITLIAAAPMAYVACFVTGMGTIMWIVTALLLLPSLVWILLVAFRSLVCPYSAQVSRAFPLALAGVAGGLLLCFSGYFDIERQEKKWGERDVLFLPRKVDGRYYGDSPLTTRRAAEDRAHVRAALAEEKE